MSTKVAGLVANGSRRPLPEAECQRPEKSDNFDFVRVKFLQISGSRRLLGKDFIFSMVNNFSLPSFSSLASYLRRFCGIVQLFVRIVCSPRSQSFYHQI
jgi:hypothetical protein